MSRAIIIRKHSEHRIEWTGVGSHLITVNTIGKTRRPRTITDQVVAQTGEGSKHIVVTTHAGIARGNRIEDGDSTAWNPNTTTVVGIVQGKGRVGNRGSGVTIKATSDIGCRIPADSDVCHRQCAAAGDTATVVSRIAFDQRVVDGGIRRR